MEGCSIREIAAMFAMVGLLASEARDWNYNSDESGRTLSEQERYQSMADEAVPCAEVLLKRLGRE